MGDRARFGACTRTPSLGLLIVARLIQGVAGGIFPLSFAIARDEFPPARVAGSIGLMSAILGVGGGLGLVAGGLIVENLSWHWLFWIPLPAMLVAAACTWWFTGRPTLALLAAGLALCGVWIVVELRSSHPLVDIAMMRVRGVWTANLAAFCSAPGCTHGSCCCLSSRSFRQARDSATGHRS
jgi:MFS family permease